METRLEASCSILLAIHHDVDIEEGVKAGEDVVERAIDVLMWKMRFFWRFAAYRGRPYEPRRRFTTPSVCVCDIFRGEAYRPTAPSATAIPYDIGVGNMDQQCDSGRPDSGFSISTSSSFYNLLFLLFFSQAPLHTFSTIHLVTLCHGSRSNPSLKQTLATLRRLLDCSTTAVTLALIPLSSVQGLFCYRRSPFKSHV